MTDVGQTNGHTGEQTLLNALLPAGGAKNRCSCMEMCQRRCSGISTGAVGLHVHPSGECPTASRVNGRRRLDASSIPTTTTTEYSRRPDTEFYFPRARSTEQFAIKLKQFTISPAIPVGHDTIRYDMRCYINVRSKANMSQLNLPHATDN